jgi:hypothetical protein
MSTPTRSISPDDPRLTEQIIEAESPIESPQALRLLAHSLTAKARAHEDCEAFVYMYRCANDHVWPVALTCHQRFCPKCGERIARKLVRKYDAIDVGAEPFLYIEISRYGKLSPEFAEEFGKFIGAGFKHLERYAAADAQLGTLWNTIVPARNRLTARLILWGDGIRAYTRYVEAWAGAYVKVSVRPAHQFHESLHHLFEWKLPKDAKFRADCEFYFHGRRMVHTMGTLHLHKETPLESTTSDEAVEELFPPTPDTGNNSNALTGHHCPHCQSPAIAMSQRLKSASYRHPQHGFNWWDDYPHR